MTARDTLEQLLGAFDATTRDALRSAIRAAEREAVAEAVGVDLKALQAELGRLRAEEAQQRSSVRAAYRLKQAGGIPGRR